MQEEEGVSRIGKYEVLGTLGRGSMGVVYRARDPEIGRIVAIKTLRKVGANQFHSLDQALERFKMEARSAGNLRHPNLITIFEVNREGGTPYIVMDFVEGEPLDAVISRQGKLTPAQTLNYLHQAGQGLDYAHAKGVIHRDIKPSNILLDSQANVFILDFGVASISGSLGEPEDPSSSLVMGTPGYMSPEQILNEKKLDQRSDLFALAVVAFECLTGRRPFPGDNFTTVIGNILEAKPLPLTSLCPELPLSLEAEFEKALAKNRDDRFSSARDMISAFAQVLRMDPTRRSDTISLSSARPRQPSLWKSFRATATGPAVPLSQGDPLSPPVPVSMPDATTTGTGGWSKPGSKPGDMFIEGTGTFGKMPVQRRRDIGALPLVVGGLCLSLGGLVLWFALTSSEPPGASAFDEPAPRRSDPNFAANLPNSAPPPAGRTVQEMTDKQLLGVIMNSHSNEGQTVLALKEAKRRSVAGLMEASLLPLQSDSYVVRIEALKTLAELGDKRVVPQLLPVLDDHDPLVRQQAAHALARLGDRASLGYLSARMLREDNQQVKASIHSAIDKINGFSSRQQK